MSDEALASALEALDIAVFERQPDGGFTAVGRVPAWFRTFHNGATFPFLGSFLDEASAFWSEPRATPLEWGPCAGADDSGRQRQFMVAAISSPAHKFLIFELRRDVDEIQNTLQRAREQALIHEGAAKDLRTCATAIAALTAQLREAMASSERDDLLQHIASASETLIARVDRLLDAQNGRARAASR